MEKILVKRKEFHFYDQWICHRGKTSERGQNADFEKRTYRLRSFK